MRDELMERIETAISLAFEGEGEAWSDRLSGDRLARVARDAIEPIVEAALSRVAAPEQGEWIYGAQRSGEEAARRFGTRERAESLKEPHEVVVRAWQAHASTGPWEPLPEGETDAV